MSWVVKIGGLYLDASRLNSTLTDNQRRASRYAVRDAAKAAAFSINVADEVLRRVQYPRAYGHVARVVRLRVKP